MLKGFRPWVWGLRLWLGCLDWLGLGSLGLDAGCVQMLEPESPKPDAILTSKSPTLIMASSLSYCFGAKWRAKRRGMGQVPTTPCTYSFMGKPLRRVSTAPKLDGDGQAECVQTHLL